MNHCRMIHCRINHCRMNHFRKNRFPMTRIHPSCCRMNRRHRRRHRLNRADATRRRNRVQSGRGGCLRGEAGRVRNCCRPDRDAGNSSRHRRWSPSDRRIPIAVGCHLTSAHSPRNPYPGRCRRPRPRWTQGSGGRSTLHWTSPPRHPRWKRPGWCSAGRPTGSDALLPPRRRSIRRPRSRRPRAWWCRFRRGRRRSHRYPWRPRSLHRKPR